ncbi:hypothetical protein BJ546DRAFT_945887 [Cryomyces antarcticus]
MAGDKGDINSSSQRTKIEDDRLQNFHSLVPPLHTVDSRQSRMQGSWIASRRSEGLGVHPDRIRQPASLAADHSVAIDTKGTDLFSEAEADRSSAHVKDGGPEKFALERLGQGEAVAGTLLLSRRVPPAETLRDAPAHEAEVASTGRLGVDTLSLTDSRTLRDWSVKQSNLASKWTDKEPDLNVIRFPCQASIL